MDEELFVLIVTIGISIGLLLVVVSTLLRAHRALGIYIENNEKDPSEKRRKEDEKNNTYTRL